MDKKVTEYIKKQTELQQGILKKLRRIILSLKVVEEMKMGVPFYGGGKYYLYAGKHGDVNLGVSVKGMKKGVKEKLKGKGKYMRHLKFVSVGDIDSGKVKKILKGVGKPVEEREM